MGGADVALPEKPPPSLPPKCDAVDAPYVDERYAGNGARPCDEAPAVERVATDDGDPCGARAPMATAVLGCEKARAWVRPRLFTLAD